MEKSVLLLLTEENFFGFPKEVGAVTVLPISSPHLGFHRWSPGSLLIAPDARRDKGRDGLPDPAA
jgi:hypothetical protein